VVTMAALSWVLSGRALRTVSRLTERAEDMSPSNAGTGLPVPSGDVELTRLVTALNRMLGRLHEQHAAELAFAVEAGHRLRTPVATLRAEAELALRETDPTAMAEALDRIVGDADQLTTIVDRMLARNQAHAQRSESVLSTIAEASPRWHRQAELACVLLSVDLDASITPQTSTVGLLDVVEPILDNAVRHTTTGGRVRVALHLTRDAEDLLEVIITNEGPPIPPGMASRIFEPWVSGRDASVAGGLGLWLARETARDRGGEVQLVNTLPPEPTIFRARLVLERST
jgi:signal transduction histidine kinase